VSARAHGAADSPPTDAAGQGCPPSACQQGTLGEPAHDEPLPPVPGYETHIYDGGKEALFLLFLSFLIAFALTRLYTRLARVYGSGSASVGGVHLHHAVPGLVLALGAGLLAFTPWGSNSPAQEALGIAFGVSAALVLDDGREDAAWRRG
jgi:hypothetical protein